MKAYRGSGYIAPFILNLGTKWKSLVSLTVWPPYPRCPLNRSVCGPKRRFGCFRGEREGSCPFRDSNSCSAYAKKHSPHVFDVCWPTHHLNFLSRRIYTAEWVRSVSQLGASSLSRHLVTRHVWPRYRLLEFHPQVMHFVIWRRRGMQDIRSAVHPLRRSLDVAQFFPVAITSFRTHIFESLSDIDSVPALRYKANNIFIPFSLTLKSPN